MYSKYVKREFLKKQLLQKKKKQAEKEEFDRTRNIPDEVAHVDSQIDTIISLMEQVLRE